MRIYVTRFPRWPRDPPSRHSLNIPLLALAALPSAFLACLIMHFYLMSRERKAILLEPILALAQAAAAHMAYE